MGLERLTQSELKRVLSYDMESGLFTWNKNRSRVAKKGGIAGTVDKDGYRIICISRRNYRAHRLAWLYMTGSFPTAYVDHINRDRLDNSWENLREATKSQNAQNSTFSRSRTGVRGTYWDKDRSSWVAKISIHGKTHHLGRFDTAESAGEAYRCARQKLHQYAPEAK